MLTKKQQYRTKVLKALDAVARRAKTGAPSESAADVVQRFIMAARFAVVMETRVSTDDLVQALTGRS